MQDEQILQVFSNLTFDEQKHIYYWNGARVAKSVSAIVNDFTEKFDTEKILPISAAKASREENRTVSVHELRHRWQTINKTACELGTKTHKFLENFSGIQTPTSPQERAGISYLESLRGKYKISFRELRAYSEKYDFAGTMDIPLEDIHTGDRYIADYKTNGDLFKSYSYLKPPFDFLEDSAYNKYQIQLSLYRILLEDIGVRIKGTSLVYLKADGTYKVYPLEDFSPELRLCLNKKISILC